MGLFSRVRSFFQRRKTPQLGSPIITQAEASAGATGTIVDTSGGGGATSSVPTYSVSSGGGGGYTAPTRTTTAGGTIQQQTQTQQLQLMQQQQPIQTQGLTQQQRFLALQNQGKVFMDSQRLQQERARSLQEKKRIRREELSRKERRQERRERLKEKYEEAESFVSEKTTKKFPTLKGWEKQFYSKLTPEEQAEFERRVITIKETEKPSAKVWRGIGTGIYEDIQERPLKQVALFGAGAGIGAGASGVVRGTTSISPVVGKVTQVSITGAGIGLTGLYGYKVFKDVKSTEDPFGKGKVIGVASKDIFLIGAGSRMGMKSYQKGRGWWKTRGREYVPLEDLTTPKVYTGKETFPTAPRGKQLQIFRKGITGKQIGEPAGAFHTTPEKFWRMGMITPERGTSELAGIYGSPYVSPYFSGVKTPSGTYKLFGSGFAGDPAIAYLKPKGFRVSRFTKTPKGYKWKTPPKTGYADVPLMKTEVEAVFRPEAGAYGFESGKFYTKIEGVKLPIDVFKFTRTPTRITPIRDVSLIGGAKSYSVSSLRDSSIIRSTDPLGLGLVSGKPSDFSISTIEVSPTILSPPRISYPSRPSMPSYPSYPSAPSYSLPSYTPPPSTPISPPISPSSSLPISPPIISPPVSYPYKPPKLPPISPLPYHIPSYKPPVIQRTFFKPIKQEMPTGSFTVFLRRFGKFKPIGKFPTMRQASERGRLSAVRTLGATFKVEGRGAIPTPRGFYRKTSKKEGILFIEMPKFRLSTPTEIKEIQIAKRGKKFKLY